jgi:hypothetical protein
MDSGVIAYKTSGCKRRQNTENRIQNTKGRIKNRPWSYLLSPFSCLLTSEFCLLTPMWAIDKYFPAINMVLFGNIWPKKAIGKVRKRS